MRQELSEGCCARKPKALLLENVRGLLTMEDGSVFNTIKEDLLQCGYQVCAGFHLHLPNSRRGPMDSRMRFSSAPSERSGQGVLMLPPSCHKRASACTSSAFEMMSSRYWIRKTASSSLFLTLKRPREKALRCWTFSKTRRARRLTSKSSPTHSGTRSRGRPTLRSSPRHGLCASSARHPRNASWRRRCMRATGPAINCTASSWPL
mmetsp:Transcript_3223/g.12911  ORF Transcript_3223/g.12911 Transcript_3223/m.12911 type:complete len:206 (+) Transcript_3223:716-1333(+)